MGLTPGSRLIETPESRARTWGTEPAYWMVTGIETLLASDPLVLVPVPVTVTTPLNGIGPELLPPPPQETAPNITQSNSSPTRVLRKARRLRALPGMRLGLKVSIIPRTKTKVA